jgi:hypothetical protein
MEIESSPRKIGRKNLKNTVYTIKCNKNLSNFKKNTKKSKIL